MAHPVMYDEDDPWLGRLRGLCARLPESREVVAHGRPTFRAGEKGKVYACFGGSEKTPAGQVPHEAALLVKPDPDDREALVQDPRTWVPAYLGAAGWLGLDLDAEDLGCDAFWDEVAELLDASYRTVARPTLLARLDRDRPPGSLP